MGEGIQPPPEYDAEQMGNGFAVKGLSIEQKGSQVPVSAGLRGCSVKESHVAVRALPVNPSHLFFPPSVEDVALGLECKL